MKTDRHDFEPSYTGMVCDRMVLRDGYETDCGLSRFEQVHRGHDRDGHECAPEICGGVGYDPCTYGPSDIERFKCEALAEFNLLYRRTTVKRRPYFAIARRPAGWMVRLHGGNHQRVLWSELYTREPAAWRAIEIAAEAFGATGAARLVKEIDER